MSLAQIAERYARAIFELGVESGELSSLTDQIERVARAYRESQELRVALADPVVTEAARRGLIDELAPRLGLSGTAKNAVLLLSARRRLIALPEIARCLARLADEQANVVRVLVTSAEPLSEAYSAELVQKLELGTGRKVVLEKRHDATLIAGVVVTIGDNTIDGSLKGRLRQVEQHLLATG